MKSEKVSKERQEIEDLLIMYLRIYWKLRAAHFNNLDEKIDELVEFLKKKKLIKTVPPLRRGLKTTKK
jgi:hypothetical protein